MIELRNKNAPKMNKDTTASSCLHFLLQMRHSGKGPFDFAAGDVSVDHMNFRVSWLQTQHGTEADKPGRCQMHAIPCGAS